MRGGAVASLAGNIGCWDPWQPKWLRFGQRVNGTREGVL